MSVNLLARRLYSNNNIPSDLKDRFILNGIRINDIDYLENFCRNNNILLLKQFEKINKDDKEEYNKLVNKKSNLVAKNVEQINDNLYKEISRKNVYYDDYDYPTKGNVLQITDAAYKRLLNGKNYSNNKRYNKNYSNIKNIPKIDDETYKRLLKNKKIYK